MAARLRAVASVTTMVGAAPIGGTDGGAVGVGIAGLGIVVGVEIAGAGAGAGIIPITDMAV